jgi:hypothetical protein
MIASTDFIFAFQPRSRASYQIGGERGFLYSPEVAGLGVVATGRYAPYHITAK